MDKSRILRLFQFAKLRAVTLPSFALALLVIGCVAMAGQAKPAKPDANSADKIDSQDTAACMACHAEAQEGFKAVHDKALGKSVHKDLKCQDCHSSINTFPHTKEMRADKATCGKCHAEEQDAYSQSSHSHPDKSKGDHPTCVTCHANGDAHDVVAVKSATRANTALLCSSCHQQVDRMSKYGVDTDAVSSYNESFHGKAVLKFKNLKAAICIDCHGVHDVLPPENPKAHTNRANGAMLCSKPDCHPGANVTFAMSGANHLRLMVKKGPILHAIDLFFRVLTGGMILFLTGGVALDLRKKVFGKVPPRSGRIPALLTSLSFMGMVVALTVAAFDRVLEATYCFAASIGVLLLAYLVYFVTRAKNPANGNQTAPQPHYTRFDKVHRIQHILLMVSFTLLILTGMPLRFFQVDVLHQPWSFIGGLTGARMIHRIGAVTLIFIWTWHVLDLLWRWKKQGFKFSALTMLPNMKDVRDFFHTSLAYVGLANSEPKYDRFQVPESNLIIPNIMDD